MKKQQMKFKNETIEAEYNERKSDVQRAREDYHKVLNNLNLTREQMDKLIKAVSYYKIEAEHFAFTSGYLTATKELYFEDVNFEEVQE